MSSKNRPNKNTIQRTPNRKSLVGMYVLENWVNGDFVSNHLRYINRENKKYYVSDVQRTVKSYDKEPRQYVHIAKWATRFFKENSELGFRRSVTNLCNTDGVMTYSISDDLSFFKCKYTFEEVFEQDLRKIQSEKDYPLWQKIRHSLTNTSNSNNKDNWVISLTEQGLEPDGTIGGWDNNIIFFLKERFKVTHVYSTSYEKIIEYNKQSILTKTGTLFHINHFGGYNKKEISFEDNYFNRTIMFWLFDDRLVFQYEQGKETF